MKLMLMDIIHIGCQEIKKDILEWDCIRKKNLSTSHMA